MDIKITNPTYLNKKIFLSSFFIAIFVNLMTLYLFGYIISNVKPAKLPQNPKVKFIEIKKTEKKEHKKIVQRKKENRKKISKLSKPKGKKLKEKPIIPMATPILPESVQLKEKEILLPENQEDMGNFPESDIKIGKLKEYKPVLEGNFNPAFGTKLKKFDKTAFGTAVGRLIVYKPPTPKIKTVLPPPSKIKVKLWINPDGTVDRVEVVYPKALGDLKLKQIIESYVLSWKFNAISSDKKQWAITTIKFKPEK